MLPNDYKNYLKAAIASDGEIVTYRQLSRAMKVHVNVAKEMLYEFHKDSNISKPNSCHATYIISGERKLRAHKSRTDVDEMDIDDGVDGSSFKESGDQGSDADVVHKSIVLVSQENLTAVKANFQTISSMHVYSLEPNVMNDMMILTDNSREVQKLNRDIEPKVLGDMFGSILNPVAIRRGNAPPKTETSKAAAQAKPAPSASTTTAKPDKKTDTKPANSIISTASTASSSAPKKPTASVKRAPSDFFKSMGGNVTGKKVASSSVPSSVKPAPKSPNSSRSHTPPSAAVSKMDLDDDDDDNEDEQQQSEETQEEKELRIRADAAAFEERRAQEEKLRNMMNDSDEENEVEDIKPNRRGKAKPNQKSTRKIIKPDPDDASDEDDIPTSAQPQLKSSSPVPSMEQPAATQSSSGARRRARRRVEKKIETEDEDGYINHTMEMVWESYSEEEPEMKPQPPPQPAAVGKKTVPSKRAASEKDEESKGAKKTAKGRGQGNIMSFFGKK